MRVVKIVHFGGTTITFIDPCNKMGWPMMRMEIHNSKITHTLELNTEIMEDLRHALRQASKITRAREKQMGRR